MTLVSPGKSARTKSEAVSCEIPGNLYTLYTCPANCLSEVTMLFIVNANGNTDVSAFWYRASDTASYNLVGGKNLIAGESILLTGATLALAAGDKITVVASGNATPNIDAMCTVTETFLPVG